MSPLLKYLLLFIIVFLILLPSTGVLLSGSKLRWITSYCVNNVFHMMFNPKQKSTAKHPNEAEAAAGPLLHHTSYKPLPPENQLTIRPMEVEEDHYRSAFFHVFVFLNGQFQFRDYKEGDLDGAAAAAVGIDSDKKGSHPVIAIIELYFHDPSFKLPDTSSFPHLQMVNDFVIEYGHYLEAMPTEFKEKVFTEGTLASLDYRRPKQINKARDEHGDVNLSKIDTHDIDKYIREHICGSIRKDKITSLDWHLANALFSLSTLHYFINLMNLLAGHPNWTVYNDEHKKQQLKVLSHEIADKMARLKAYTKEHKDKSDLKHLWDAQTNFSMRFTILERFFSYRQLRGEVHVESEIDEALVPHKDYTIHMLDTEGNECPVTKNITDEQPDGRRLFVEHLLIKPDTHQTHLRIEIKNTATGPNQATYGNVNVPLYFLNEYCIPRIDIYSHNNKGILSCIYAGKSVYRIEYDRGTGEEETDEEGN